MGKNSDKRHNDANSNLIVSICYIWWIEMKNTIKDEGVLIFFIIVPLLYPLLYSWIYNNEVVRDVPVVVVDQSHTATSREFIRMFDASPDVKVAYYCNSIPEAESVVGHQKANGILYFPEDFERTINRGEQAHVSIYCDMSLMLAYKAIYQTSLYVSLNIGKERQKEMIGTVTVRDEELRTQPLEVAEEPIFNVTGGYGNAVLPGVLILILQQTLLLGIGLAAGTARENNRYQDLVPISKHHNGILKIVLGKSFCYFMIYCVISAYITLAVPYIFNFTMLAAPADLIRLLLPYLLSVIFFGMTLSCLVRHRENVMLLVVFTSVPFLFLTGVSWPQSSIPGVWEGIAWLIPSTFGVRGFLRLSSMGGTFADIRTEVLALWSQAIVYFSITCLVYRYQIISARKHAIARASSMKDKIEKVRATKKLQSTGEKPTE
ncbi:ABC transporter permease [Prevotella aurantiaca]|jgi:ABC-2 type transporter|uniref:ABC transporter permease n=1 Tax=Prevotella aurantiaca TaxID=596085 RepID=A0A930HNE5_9BACT|nr:ABC transporter permease [Prevotella aurantiaca]MBF1385034.1 ABC transporter permease [Prevotella aurantiaca]MBF1385391.1 ABC transporter permease [Prevotella aurantiaca]